METYCFKNISYTYGGSTEVVLKNVSFDVLRGEFVVVCGASGSGKTTLLHIRSLVMYLRILPIRS